MAKVNIVYKVNSCDKCSKPASLVCEEYLHYLCEDHDWEEEDDCPACEPIRLIKLSDKSNV